MSERLDIFLKSVTDYADLQCRKLERAAETRMQKEITAYKKQAVLSSRSNTARETDKIRSNAANKAAEYESKKRLALAALRKELSDGLFDGVAEKIDSFTKSSEYPKFLMKSAENLLKVIGSDIVFYLRPCDMVYSEILQNLAENAVVKEDASIRLGGIAATDKDETLRADDTLDSRLKTEKKAFFENAEFKIL